MNRRLMLGALLAVVLVGAGAAQAGYMELVSATPIVYEGTPAWEYYYDVYSDGVGSATQIWMDGFDPSLLLNPLNQRWDGAAADGWGEGMWGNYPAIGDGDPEGTDQWVLTGNPGAMLNPIHPPSAYLPEMRRAMMYEASATATGIHYWYGSNVQYVSGLYMTIRLVHPLAPGPINYSIIGPFWWDQQNTPIIGPVVPEPMTLSLLAVGATALIRRRRRA